LHALLPAGRGAAVENIRSGTPKPLKHGHLGRIYSEILAHAAPTDDVSGLLELVRKIAADAGTPPELLNEACIAVGYPVPPNPWAGGEDGRVLREAEQTCSRAEQWISDTDTVGRTPALAFYRLLVASILDFRILHADFIPAVLRSVRDERDFTIHPQIKVLPLSLSYGRQENSERRLLILRRRTLKLFEEFCAQDGCTRFCEVMSKQWSAASDTQNESRGPNESRGLDQVQAPNQVQAASEAPGEVTGEVEKPAAAGDRDQATTESKPEAESQNSASSEGLSAHARLSAKVVLADLEREAAKAGQAAGGLPDLTDLIEKARVIARFHLPSIVVAHRSRQIVSHSLPPEVLARIGGWKLEPFRLARSGNREDQEYPFEEPPEMQDDPGWLKDLRQALGPTKVDNTILNLLIGSNDPAGRIMGAFAIFLSTTPTASRAAKQKTKNQNGCAPATVRRYCLLIANRLMPRLVDPAAGMSEDGWEDAIEQLLDEDAFFNLNRYRQAPTSKAQAYSRPLVKAVRHWLRFIREAGMSQPRTGDETARSAELSGLEKRLPVLGLVAVDASLITVDEYLRALKRLRGARGPIDKNLREAACVALILGYRLGLRRKEAAGLRLPDIDSIEYLHVRPNRMRQLKTSNAKRDLPMPLLVPKRELDYIRERLRGLRTKTQQKHVQPGDIWLFSQSGDPQKAMDFDAVIAEIHEAFRGNPERRWEPIDSTFHYHRLRHSFCNLTLLRLWPPLHRIAEKLLRGHHPETMDWIRDEKFRETLFGTERVTESDLQAIALLMGHGSAETSLEHYTHLLDAWEDPATWTRAGDQVEEQGPIQSAENIADRPGISLVESEQDTFPTNSPAAERRRARLTRKPPSRA
jgi:integrase